MIEFATRVFILAVICALLWFRAWVALAGFLLFVAPNIIDMRFRKPKPAATSAHKQATPKPNKDHWYSSRLASSKEYYVYLANDHLMRDGLPPGGGIPVDRAVKFGSVAHDDPDFEVKWATLLAKAKRRCDVLNQKGQFSLPEVEKAMEEEGKKSICANCNKDFEGEDFLCPECREDDGVS